MLLDLTLDELKQLEYELRYREGELLGGGDNEQANRLASITDKLFQAREDKPFWSVEYGYLKKRAQLESDCYNAKTLQDAIICGANMTYLDGEQVGYLAPDGAFELYGEWLDGDKAELCLSDIAVEFSSLDRDDDGYTVARFERSKNGKDN